MKRHAALVPTFVLLAVLSSGTANAKGLDPSAYLSSPASELFAMAKQGALTPHVDALWTYALTTLDSVDYVNDTYADGSYVWPPDKRIAWRHALACMGYAMPSIALIEPARTREVAFNLHLVVKHLHDPLMEDRYSPYGSDHVMLVHRALTAGLYRLITGRALFDRQLGECAARIHDLIRENADSGGPWALDTVKGSYEAPLNAMALLALEVHDRALGGNLSEVKGKVLEFLEARLVDRETGLFYESLVIPQIGLKSERATLANAQIAKATLPAVNALALVFLHPVAPDLTARGWTSFKSRFEKDLLRVEAEQFGASVAQSFYLPVGGPADAFLAAMVAARELDDPVFFQKLEDRLRSVGGPHTVQGELRYEMLTDAETTLVNGLILFAKAHVGWGRILDHGWAAHYDEDYDRVR